MRRGAPRPPAPWLLGLALGVGVVFILTAATPGAQARRPKARAAAQASQGPAGSGHGSTRRARKGRRPKPRKRSSKGAPRDAKRVGKTGLVRLKYTVKPGDTLNRVARKLHVTVEQLRWWNRWLREGSSLRAGARVAYLVTQAELDRREAAHRKAAKARDRRSGRRPRKGHRRAAKVAREALVRAGDEAPPTPTAVPKNARSLRVARATPEDLGETRPAPPTSPAPPEDAAADAPGERPATSGREQPLPPGRSADPAARSDASNEAVAKVAGAARGVVAAMTAAGVDEGPAPGATRAAGHGGQADSPPSARAEGKRRTTAGDFPSYRVPASRKHAEAIGSPNKGRLRHGVEMPIRGPGFRRISTKKRFATDQTIALIRYAAARLAAQFPGTQPMLVNALSAKGGGRVRPHHSHQNGLDVDILYFQKGNPRHPKRGNLRPDEVDYVKTWFVLETLLLTGKFNYAFTDRSFIPGLRRQARRAGWTKRALRKIFGDPSGKGRKGLIRHWAGHRDHIHIRFTCHPADKRCEHSHFY